MEKLIILRTIPGKKNNKENGECERKQDWKKSFWKFFLNWEKILICRYIYFKYQMGLKHKFKPRSITVELRIKKAWEVPLRVIYWWGMMSVTFKRTIKEEFSYWKNICILQRYHAHAEGKWLLITIVHI